MSTGYKVVRPFSRGIGQGHGLCSSFIQLSSCVEYIPENSIKPKTGHGPLCVFTNLLNAEVYRINGEQIWECEYEKSKEMKVWTGPFETTLDQLRTGTALASSVTLLRRVK